MWQDEVQRIGKRRCTPVGYNLHGISDLIGFLAIILLISIPCYLVYSAFRGSFTWLLLLLLLVPFAVAIIGNILHSYSWRLAETREFKYDYEKRLSTWRNPNGTMQTFCFDDWNDEYRESSASSDG